MLHRIKVKIHVSRRVANVLTIITLIVIISIGTWIRAVLTPYTAGPDIPQFAGFADTFLRHGLCFFKHVGTNSSNQERWPYPWPYPYGVLPALLLGLARVIAPQSIEIKVEGSALRIYTPVEWIIALKTIYIVSDIVSAILIFLIVSSWSRRLAIIATAIFYLNPLTIYISSVFGQLDPVATALYLAGLLLYLKFAERNDNFLIATGALIGLSATSKPNMVIPAGALVIYLIVQYFIGRRRFSILKLLSGFIIGSILPFLVFEASCPGGLITLYGAMSDVGKVGYYHGIVYSLNGFTSLASYMHFKTNKDFLWIIEKWWIPGALLTSILLIGLFFETRYRKRIPSLIHVVYLAYLVYLSTYWKIHYQYFVGLLALYSLLLADRSVSLLNKIQASIHSILIVAYTIMFPTSFWAWYYIRNPNNEIIKLLDMFSLRIYDEETYLVYSIVLTFVGYLVVISYTLTAISTTRNRLQIVRQDSINSDEKLVSELMMNPTIITIQDYSEESA